MVEEKTKITNEEKVLVEEKNTEKKEKKDANSSTDDVKIKDKKDKPKPTVSLPKKKSEEKKIEIEREYIVPLRKGFLNVPHYRRAKKAVKTLKEFMVRHMKIRDGDTRKVKVNIHLNNEIWFRGIKNPLNKIKVKAKKIEDVVYVELADVPSVVKFKMAREEKRKLLANKDKKVKKPKEKVEKEKLEEKEDVKAESELSVKKGKGDAKNMKHTTKGEHGAKTTPVRKVLK